MGPRASLDAMVKRKISCLCWELNCSSSAIQPRSSLLYQPSLLCPVSRVMPGKKTVYQLKSARGSVVGWGTMLQTGRSLVWIPDEVDFFSLPNPSSCTMARGSTQPLTEMSTRNLPGGKKRPARRADNLAAIYVPNVWHCGSLNLSQP
jgi:hypothetical protein